MTNKQWIYRTQLEKFGSDLESIAREPNEHGKWSVLIAQRNLCFDEWFSKEKLTCKYHYSANLL